MEALENEDVSRPSGSGGAGKLKTSAGPLAVEALENLKRQQTLWQWRRWENLKHQQTLWQWRRWKT